MELRYLPPDAILGAKLRRHKAIEFMLRCEKRELEKAQSTLLSGILLKSKLSDDMVTNGAESCVLPVILLSPEFKDGLDKSCA